MIKTDDRSVINWCEDESSNIKEYFPAFYEANKEKVDKGLIRFYHEGNAVKAGFLVDLETLTAISVSFT